MKVSSIILFCFISASLYSQSSRPKDINDAPQIKERIANNGRKATPEIRVSNYYGLDDQIKNLLISGQIPEAFPKALNYSVKKDYIEAVNAWIRDNQSQINHDKKNTFISE